MKTSVYCNVKNYAKNGLKPCPFCGSSARISHGDSIDRVFGEETYVVAMCNSCGIRTPKFYYSSEHNELNIAEEMVAKRWNRRVDNGM